jgi:hypothetical protein
MKTTRNQNLMAAVALSLGALSIASAVAQDAKSKPAPAQRLITNARIFGGKSDQYPDAMSVLIKGNKIAMISRTAPTPATGAVRGRPDTALDPPYIRRTPTQPYFQSGKLI